MKKTTKKKMRSSQKTKSNSITKEINVNKLIAIELKKRKNRRYKKISKIK